MKIKDKQIIKISFSIQGVKNLIEKYGFDYAKEIGKSIERQINNILGEK